MNAHILIVDDNDQLLHILEELLASSGYDVSIASNGSAALESLGDHIPDLIICDIMMPEMNGYQLLEAVQGNDDWCQIPFVFLTALADGKEIRTGKERGCDEYLTKPFSTDELLSVVRGKLRIAENRRRSGEAQFEQYRKRIIHTLSHEFRTPLVAINTGTELVLEERNRLDDNRLFHLLKSIQRGGMRLQRLVEDFMTLQQIDSGAARATCERLRSVTSLPDVVSSAVERYQDERNDSIPQIDLVFEEPDSIGVTDVYREQVINSIMRVLDNAQKFAGNDKPVTVRVRGDEKHTSILIRDRGPGFPNDIKEKAQTLFTQIGRDKLEQQGCGLGLTIANFFTDLNGGTLLFHEPEDDQQGLEVELRFPRARVEMNATAGACIEEMPLHAPK